MGSNWISCWNWILHCTMILGLIIFILTLAAKLVYDVNQYNKHLTINHAKEAFFVSLALLGASFFGGWLSVPIWFFGFWVLFDGFFNLFINQKWGYIGNTAKLDQLQHKYPFLTWIKYVALAASITLFFTHG